MKLRYYRVFGAKSTTCRCGARSVCTFHKWRKNQNFEFHFTPLSSTLQICNKNVSVHSLFIFWNLADFEKREIYKDRKLNQLFFILLIIGHRQDLVILDHLLLVVVRFQGDARVHHTLDHLYVAVVHVLPVQNIFTPFLLLIWRAMWRKTMFEKSLVNSVKLAPSTFLSTKF